MLLHCIVYQQNCTNIFSNKLSKNQDKANFDKAKSLTITIIIKIICFYDKVQNIYCDIFISGKIFGKGQQEKIQRFVKFVVFCYIPWWLTAPVSSSASKNDLLF